MNPRLIAISGPLEGKTIPLSGERFVLGRQTGCDLQIPSVEVSRRHCELRRGSHGSWTVLDLDSRHGVFVNHRPVREGRLAHSDLLSVGTSVLLFLLDEASPGSRSGAFEPPPAGVSAGSTLTRHASDLLYLDRSRVEDALPAQARIARDLHALLRASTALQGPLDVTELGRRLLAAAAEVCPAERLALSTLEAGDESPVPVCRRRRGSDTEADFDPSPAVLEQVIGERAGILWTLADDQAPTRSLIAAPLLDPRGRVNAVLQAESPVEDAFEERHLELLGALAGIASPALENALRWRRLEAEAERLKAQQLSHDLVGESPSIVRLLELIARVARVDTTVLIRGESGTGKELVAQAIHRSSERARGPFVAINCATLSETLIESEL
ncbi:MAG: sigma 54-interacting transcriptional regulator, partial [Acidobacteria bacterium]|nr:sigma 54-interacting transcriptional regulator [Acidobacteriota bacterium]